MKTWSYVPTDAMNIPQLILRLLLLILCSYCSNILLIPLFLQILSSFYVPTAPMFLIMFL